MTIYDEIIKIIQQSPYKLTPQREKIVEILVENDEQHLSAEELYFILKEKTPDIGIATVYRTLDIFYELKILEKTEDKFSLNIEVDAGISILKGDKMDLTIQKLTELGINKIIPISVKRCVVKLDKKKDRWEIISKEALKQCQGVAPTVIDEIKKIDKLNFKDYDLILVPYENEKEIFIKEIFRDLKVKPTKILYIIGAEGGFEKEEINYLKENGAKIISLGKRILRAETAAIVTGGVIINEFF